MAPRLPRVALVGRVNAGKSTLFNTLIHTSRALISPQPGTTRDLNIAEMTWRGKTFEIVDSGGLDAWRLGEIEQYVQRKAYQAIQTADLVVLLIDGRYEPTVDDRRIAKTLKKSRQKIILALNKLDGPASRRDVSPDFYRLGLGAPCLISALNGSGTGDLLDEIVQRLPHRERSPVPIDVKLSIIGKTNVGKSSLFNALVGEERVIVTPLPHTTREPQDTLLKFRGKNILLVDTTGLRKKPKMTSHLEALAAKKTGEAIRRSDVSLLVTNVLVPLSNQDQDIARLALEHQNGIILVANKWDLIADKSPQTINTYIEYYQRYFPWLWWAPIVFASALEKQRISKIVELALAVHRARQRWLPQEALNTLIQKMRQVKKVGRPDKKKPRGAYRLQQIDVNPPRFLLLVPRREDVHPAFLNLLEKKLRAAFDLNGTPLSITLQRSKS